MEFCFSWLSSIGENLLEIFAKGKKEGNGKLVDVSQVSKDWGVERKHPDS